MTQLKIELGPLTLNFAYSIDTDSRKTSSAEEPQASKTEALDPCADKDGAHAPSERTS